MFSFIALWHYFLINVREIMINDMSKLINYKINENTLFYGIPYPQDILDWLAISQWNSPYTYFFFKRCLQNIHSGFKKGTIKQGYCQSNEVTPTSFIKIVDRSQSITLLSSKTYRKYHKKILFSNHTVHHKNLSVFNMGSAIFMIPWY